MNAIGNGSVAAKAFDLSPAGDSRLHLMAIIILRELRGKLADEKWHLGPRANNAHVTFQRVDNFQQRRRQNEAGWLDSGFRDGGGCSTTLSGNIFSRQADALLTPTSTVFVPPLIPRSQRTVLSSPRIPPRRTYPLVQPDCTHCIWVATPLHSLRSVCHRQVPAQ